LRSTLDIDPAAAADAALLLTCDCADALAILRMIALEWVGATWREGG
jgi:hypothetical protein